MSGLCIDEHLFLRLHLKCDYKNDAYLNWWKIICGSIIVLFLTLFLTYFKICSNTMKNISSMNITFFLGFRQNM